MKPEEYTIYERVPALSPGSFDERPMRRNLRITKLHGAADGALGHRLDEWNDGLGGQICSSDHTHRTSSSCTVRPAAVGSGS